MEQIERVVLVHRLREVVAQVAFTRFEAAAPDIEGELDIGVRRASLAREVSWLPAFENKGEGIFLQFKTKAIVGLAATARGSSTRSQTERGIRGMAKGTSGDDARVSRCRISDAAFVFSSSDHSAIAELWLSREFDPRARICDPKCRLWRFALHRNFGCRRDARWIGAGGSKNPRDRQGSIGLGNVVFKRSGVRAA